MSERRVLVHRFRLLRFLRWSLGAGAAYDVSFAVAMCLAPQLPARILSLPLPGARFYLWILATLLAMLAALYLLAAFDPRRYSGIIAIAIVGRAVGAFAFALAAWGDPSLAGLYPLAAADLTFAVAHTALWLPIR